LANLVNIIFFKVVVVGECLQLNEFSKKKFPLKIFFPFFKPNISGSLNYLAASSTTIEQE